MAEGFEESDSEIIQQIIRGNTDKYALLVKRYQGYVFLIALKAVGERTVAEELTQEIFVRSFFALRGFRAEASFKTWLTRITLNAINSKLRAQNSELLTPFVFDSRRYPAVSPFDSISVEQREQGLYASIGSLKPKFRAVVELCSLEGRSYQEAADLLGIPVGTVCSRMNTAFKILRRRLAKL